MRCPAAPALRPHADRTPKSNALRGDGRRLCLLVSILWLAPAAAAASGSIVLQTPLDCEIGKTCAIQQYVDHDPSKGARDYQCGTLSYDGHNGTDFRLPTLAAQRAGVDVLAAADGIVERTRDGMEDVSIADRGVAAVGNRMCGNGVVIAHAGGWETQYCHMAKGSVRVRPGQRLGAGTPLGRVGLSGATVFPHLHFTVRRGGTVVDPFAFGATAACGSGTSLWHPAAGPALAYRARAVLNAGFSAAAVTMEEIESGASLAPAPGTDPAALVAYVRSIGLRAGDVQEIALFAPDGSILLRHVAKALDRPQAQTMLFAGKKRPEGGWPSGTYRVTYRVLAAGEPVLEQAFSAGL